MDRDEWTRRYASHLVQVGGLSVERAEGFAQEGAELCWQGGSSLYGPEEAADEEMSYWED